MKSRLILLITAISFTALLSNCKKQQTIEVKQKPIVRTLSELKTIIVSDTGFNNALLAIKTLNNLKQLEINQAFLVPTNHIKTLSVSMPIDSVSINNIKTKADVQTYFRSKGYANSDIIASQLSIIAKSVNDFAKKYLEGSKLSKEDIDDLVSTAFKDKSVNDVNLSTFSNIRLSDCAYTFNASVAGCGTAYEDGISMAFFTAAAGGESGIGDVIALIEVVYAYENYYKCLDSASDAYFHC